jgi:hypothetical protein
MSNEHVWSDWLTKTRLIPDPSGGSWQEAQEWFQLDRETKGFTKRPVVHTKQQGSPLQRKVRNVCRIHCNSGWMGLAVEAAKPIATKLIQGAACHIENDDLTKLATWLAISIVMQEFTGSREIMIPREDRVSLMEKNAPPEAWRIWIGYYSGSKWHPVGHTRNSLSGSMGILLQDGTDIEVPDFKARITTFALRKLLVHAFIATDSNVIGFYSQRVRERGWNIVQLWPLAYHRIMWPRFPILDNELIDIVLGVKLLSEDIQPGIGPHT